MPRYSVDLWSLLPGNPKERKGKGRGGEGEGKSGEGGREKKRGEGRREEESRGWWGGRLLIWIKG